MRKKINNNKKSKRRIARRTARMSIRERRILKKQLNSTTRVVNQKKLEENWKTLLDVPANIQLTVALPMWKQKNIGWLPLEGLIRQKDIDFDWELLVVEETFKEPFGCNNIRPYIGKLQEIGCKKVVYSGLDVWVPLSQKWSLMGKKASQSSVCFLLQGSDDYPQPHRLKETYIFFKNNKKLCWLHSKYGIFYDIISRKSAKYDFANWGWHTGLDMAIATDLMRNLPNLSRRKKIVDGWIWKNVKKRSGKNWKTFLYVSKNWNKGLYTNSMNTLTEQRKNQITKLRPPMIKYNEDPFEHVPDLIKNKLLELNNYLK